MSLLLSQTHLASIRDSIILLMKIVHQVSLSVLSAVAAEAVQG